MNTKILSVTGKETELIVKVCEYVEILYWGCIINTKSEGAEYSLSRPIPYGRLDTDIPMTLHPELGRGLFSSPALEGHRNGKGWAPVFQTTNVKQGRKELTIYSEDKAAGLQLVTELRLDEFDVIKLRHKLINTADGIYSVNRLANTLPLPERANELLTYYGRWVNEFQQTRMRLTQGGYQQENRRGRTSHEHYPALIAGTQYFNETHGDVWGFHLAWSGNHRMRVDVKADGRRFMQAEAIYLPGEVALEKGDSIATPWLYATHSECGLNKMSQHFHQHVRSNILNNRLTKKARPIHLNTWEGIYFDHNPEYIMDMATESAKMGVERFIIDDGWFKGRCGDKAGLGDWYLDKSKYTKGLEGVIEHVNALGMEFGLWFEPEMINKDSDLYRSHPDWLLAMDNYEQPTGRNQYAIDLQNEDAFNYLFERLDYFLSKYNISYIKWDMNREIVQPGHDGYAAGHKQVEMYYRLVDKLTAKHPDVEIESCAAGGGRIDFEVLKRTHRFWASDNNDALERQQIQRGMSYFFPPEVMGSHIGAKHCHCTRRTHDINFRGLTALFGHMGIELDPVKESETEKQGFMKYIQLHKQLRPLLHSGDAIRLSTDDDAHLAHAVIATAQDKAVVLVAQLSMPTNSLSSTLRIPGLNKDKLYSISLLDYPENFHDIVNLQPLWTKEPVVASGEWLKKAGIAMPILDPESAILIGLKEA
ncbi:alpha-galactosidase [Photobacterium sp. OFAV2-7]|uniref:alpha-galactosidase n=1 Tax=Photobacterium sp. OFAV2-7 TaxID=2917748 RepID=UPI001EF63870|nr:alpha-galactosidase [Photobacterium sp. OFAV2-7]MCG7588138.1 alpha-galactosidase [Photobacterium sp. OFAV2-7]